MSYKGTYKQCLLRFDTSLQVAWIPSSFAVQGQKLLVEDRNCIVEQVYRTVELKDPIYPEELIRAHRNNTGDSLKRVKC